MSDFIPRDVLIDIFTRLCIEDLVRCISVCKSWYSLITNPSFVSLHTQSQSSPTNNNRLLRVRHRTEIVHKERYSIGFDSDTFEEYKSCNFPLSSLDSYIRVIGCCNGVLCLFEDFTKNPIVLWNPSIRKTVTLPQLGHRPCCGNSIGFAFCATSNDFKVVWLFHVPLEDGHVDKVPKLEVYDLSKGCWRSVDSKGFPYTVDHRCRQAYLNGAVHWTGSNMFVRDDKLIDVIVSFDMGTEELGVIQMPVSGDRDWKWQSACRVSVLEESLALIVNFKAMSIYDVCEIWVMKEYGKSESWTKLFTIDLDGGRSLEGAFGFLRNGDVLLQYASKQLSGFELASYDPKSKQVKLLGEALYVDNLVETLALLGVKGDTGKKTNKTKRQEQKTEELMIRALVDNFVETLALLGVETLALLGTHDKSGSKVRRT